MATKTIQTHLTVSQMTICEILNGGRTGGKGGSEVEEES